jgi:hypothetical protein
MSSRAIIIGAGALGALVLIDRKARTDCTGADGRKAGKANLAAAADLRARQSTIGIAFDVPESASMACAWRSMRDGIGSRTLSVTELVAICDLWLNAYDAGYQASSDGAIVDSLYNEAKVNYSTVKLPAPATARPYNPGDAPCTDDYKAFRTELGNTVCPLLEIRNSLSFRQAFGVVAAGEQQQVLDRTEAFAAAMDHADYVRDGQRASDSLNVSISEALGKLFGDVITGFVKSPGGIALLAIGGFVVWRALR